MITKTLREWSGRLDEFLADEQEHFLFAVQDKTEVGYGFAKDVNFDYCREREIATYDQKRDGGAIVFAAGNVTLAGVYDNRVHDPLLFYDILIDFVDFLFEKDISAVLDNNDVLIDGEKVASGFSYNFGTKFRRTYGGVQISVKQDLEVIKNACKKTMIKPPAALENYGVDTNAVVQWCEAWFRKHKLVGEKNKIR